MNPLLILKDVNLNAYQKLIIDETNFKLPFFQIDFIF